MAFTFREMQLCDLEQIKNDLISQFDNFWTYEILKDELSSSSSKYIAVLDKEKVIGFAGLKIVFDEADIMNIVVRNSYRSQGVGTALLDSLISLANSMSLKSILLEVNEDNNVAIHLYKKFGFQQISIRKNYYKNKSALIMKKIL